MHAHRCEFDCYEEPRHIAIVVVGVVCLVVVTVATPLLVVAVSVRKVRELRTVAGRGASDEREAELWAQYVRGDASALTAMYASLAVDRAWLGGVQQAVHAVVLAALIVPEPGTPVAFSFFSVFHSSCACTLAAQTGWGSS